VKWAKYFLCYLQGVAVRLSVLSSRAVSECFSRIAAKSTSWNWHEKAVLMKISLSSKLSWLKEVMGNLFLLAAVSLLLWGLALFAFASCSVRSSHPPSSYPSPTHMEKAEQSGYSDSSVTPPAKTRSSSRPATSPIWATPPLWESSDFILVHRQGDK
jgi:hypothetical protein